jgi:hypothetical protein
MKPTILAAVIYLGAGVACGVAFEPLWRHGPAVPYVESFVIGFGVPTIFLCSSVGVFLKPRLTYLVGLIAALLVWLWIIQNEFAYYYFSNSWAAFNSPLDPTYTRPVKLMIIAIVFLLFVTTCSIIRFSPATWSIRNLPVRDRTWPAFAVSLALVVVWFITAVVPYRAPLFHHHATEQSYVFLLHVEKQGLNYHETRVGFSPRQFDFEAAYDNRSLFHYEFDEVLSRGRLPQDLSASLTELFESPEIKGLRSVSRTSLSWNSDRWYLFSYTERGPVLRGVEKTEIPKPLLDWFYETQTLPTYATVNFVVRDVCFGFCYDPTY